mmetsp:Transcript_42947/g.96408  ORF Transcript_42947/g.96408 Transcript_42947/m.96408 type:complete len:218 (+) Transcript_42947:205-858(+)
MSHFGRASALRAEPWRWPPWPTPRQSSLRSRPASEPLQRHGLGPTSAMDGGQRAQGRPGHGTSQTSRCQATLPEGRPSQTAAGHGGEGFAGISSATRPRGSPGLNPRPDDRFEAAWLPPRKPRRWRPQVRQSAQPGTLWWHASRHLRQGGEAAAKAEEQTCRPPRRRRPSSSWQLRHTLGCPPPRRRGSRVSPAKSCRPPLAPWQSPLHSAAAPACT